MAALSRFPSVRHYILAFWILAFGSAPSRRERQQNQTLSLNRLATGRSSSNFSPSWRRHRPAAPSSRTKPVALISASTRRVSAGSSQREARQCVFGIYGEPFSQRQSGFGTGVRKPL